MFKSFILLFNVAGVLLTGIFTSDDILIDHRIPATIQQGEKKLVELTISKGPIQGFAKMEINLPMGFTATPNENKNASFTFNGGQIRMVWMDLPTEEEFTISYYLECPENMEGQYSINGSFSYVNENIREDVSIAPKAIVVEKKVEIAQYEVPTSMDDIKVEAPFEEMVCERTVSKISDTEYQVKVVVINNSIVGFGRILETVPANCKTKSINAAEAVVTQDKNSIKFVWFDVPKAKQFEVAYRVSCLTPETSLTISGQLSYTENGNPMNLDIPTTSMEGTPMAGVDTNPLPQNTTAINTTEETETVVKPSNEPKSNTTPKSNPSTTVPSNTATSNEVGAIKKTDSATASTQTNDRSITSIPDPEVGITYKVQIMAAHRVVNKTYMKTKFNFADAFNIENHEGWVKYTTGKFSNYADAREARVSITAAHQGFRGPFVTAYNNGERITVQEALLISKQQWIP
ncbi:MAG: hypothetical protein RLZZ262_1600 [Bacteroidota bacterium]|jgi:hypothetical protein